MNFLSLQSCKRLDRYFKFVGQISNYKVASYLSFYANQKGNKLSYNNKLSHQYLFRELNNKSKRSLQEYIAEINQDYMLSQSFLTGLFNNQIISLQLCNQLLKNCVDLQLLVKKDIPSFIFGSKMQYNLKNWIQNFKQSHQDEFNMKMETKDGKIPEQKRKNFFIIAQNKITNFKQLEDQIFHHSKFLEVPNINKILCLDLQVQNTMIFNNEIIKRQNFFKQKSIKIKNNSSQKFPQQFQKKSLTIGYRIHKILEYISKNVKGNTLLHQFPQYYQFYNKSVVMENSQIKNLHNFEPSQVLLLIQRTDNELMKENNKSFQFQQFAKSFTHRFKKDPYYTQTSKGFIVSRYLSNFNKKKYQKLIKMQQKGKINISLD